MRITTALLLFIHCTTWAQDGFEYFPQNWQDGDELTINSTEKTRVLVDDSLFMDNSILTKRTLTAYQDVYGYTLLVNDRARDTESSWELNAALDTGVIRQMYNQLEKLPEELNDLNIEYRVDNESKIVESIDNEDDLMFFMEDVLDKILTPLIDMILENDTVVEDAEHEEFRLMMSDSLRPVIQRSIQEKQQQIVQTTINAINSNLDVYTLPFDYYSELEMEAEIYQINQLGPLGDLVYTGIMTIGAKKLAGNKVKLTVSTEHPSEILYQALFAEESDQTESLTSPQDVHVHDVKTWVLNLNTGWPESMEWEVITTFGDSRVENYFTNEYLLKREE